MKQEVYSIKCPEHIRIGDPWYFDSVRDKRLYELVVDYHPERTFEAGIILGEEDVEGELIEFITVYLASPQSIKEYLGGKAALVEIWKSREIRVETDRCLVSIDDRSRRFDVGWGNAWGEMLELYRGGCLDAVKITLDMPMHMSFAEMKQTMQELFEGLNPFPAEKE